MRPSALFRILPFLLLLSTSVLAQPATPTPDTLWAGADGKFEGAPDTALLQFMISVQQTELKAAYAQAQDSAQKIRQMLRDNGLDPKDAEIGSFSIAPAYEWNPKRKLVGFRVSSHVTIKVRDFAKLGGLIESFSQSDKTDSFSLNYTLENMETAKAKAVEDAYRKAHLNAEILARAGGRMLGVMTYASAEANEFIPRPRPMMMNAQVAREKVAEASPIEDFTPATITVTAHVNVLFQLK
jgi:uncharacterized protein